MQLALENQLQKYMLIRSLVILVLKENSEYVDFNDKIFDNVCCVKVNSLPAVAEHLTLKHYVHNAMSNSVDESSLLCLDPMEELKLD